jgi:hypothetical protein
LRTTEADEEQPLAVCHTLRGRSGVYSQLRWVTSCNQIREEQRMILGSIVLVASILVFGGVLIGYGLNKRQIAARARRQAAAQASLYRQLDEFRAAREKKSYHASSNSGNSAKDLQHRVA